MKKLLLALALITISAICYAQPQYPINQTIGAPTTLVTSRGGFKADSSLIVPSYLDTAKANISPYGKNYPGAVIRVGDSLYMRNYTATKWINISTSGGGGGGNSWLVGGNIDATPPYIGNKDEKELDFITFNSVRMRIASSGIARGSGGAKKYLLIDTTAKYLYYGDAGSTSDTPTLQMVLNKGNLSYQKSVLIIDSVNIGSSANTVAVLSSKDSIRGSTSPYFVGLEKRFTTNYATLEFDKTTYTNKLLPILKLSSSDLDKEFRATSEKLFFKKLSGGGTTFYVQPPNTLTNNTLTLPNTTGTLIAKINGNSPDSSGNITISTGSGTVTSVATGYGLSGGTITTTGTLIVDTSASGLSGKYVRISDSSSMLSPYLRKVDTASLSNRINLKLNISDTSSMLSPYLRKVDTTNKWVNNITRTAGKDSIIYYIGSTRYAIKDSVGTNPPASGYYGAFQDNNTQTAAASNVGYPMKLRTNDLTNGITITGSDTSRITFANTGIYNLQFSSQFQNTNNQLADVTIWLRLNGTDVAGSAGFLSVPNSHGSGASNYGHIIASWNYVLSVVAGQYYEIVWSTTNHTNVTMEFYAAGNPPPSTASVIVTVTQQAGILAGTGITAIGTSGNQQTGAVQTLATGTSGTDFAISSSSNTQTFNLPTASATNRGALSTTDWSTFNGKIGASDTSVFQRKSVAAYSLKANNTNAAANVTDVTYRDNAEAAYTGSPVWTGTAPTGTTNHRYKWSQIGKTVTLQLMLNYGTAGSTNSQVTIPLPTDCPNPIQWNGWSAANDILSSSWGFLGTSTVSASTGRALLVANSTNTGFNIIVSATSGAIKVAGFTMQYFAQ